MMGKLLQNVEMHIVVVIVGHRGHLSSYSITGVRASGGGILFFIVTFTFIFFFVITFGELRSTVDLFLYSTTPLA